MEIEPITVDFPLRGEWVAGTTPAERIPSHGTDALGQRYAYDFLRIEKEQIRYPWSYRVILAHGKWFENNGVSELKRAFRKFWD